MCVRGGYWCWQIPQGHGQADTQCVYMSDSVRSRHVPHRGLHARKVPMHRLSRGVHVRGRHQCSRSMHTRQILPGRSGYPPVVCGGPLLPHPRTTNSMPRRVQVYWRWRKGNPVRPGRVLFKRRPVCVHTVHNQRSFRIYFGINQVHKHEPAPHTVAECRLPRDGGVLLPPVRPDAQLRGGRGHGPQHVPAVGSDCT